MDNSIGQIVHYQGMDRCYAALIGTRYHQGVVDLWLIPTREMPLGKFLANVPYSDEKRYGCWHDEWPSLCKLIEIL